MGYHIMATRGTAKTLGAAGIACEVLMRIGEGHPNVLDEMEAGAISFIINTPHGHDSRGDGELLRSAAVSRGISLVSTLSGATALLQALAILRESAGLPVYALQDLA